MNEQPSDRQAWRESSLSRRATCRLRRSSGVRHPQPRCRTRTRLSPSPAVVDGGVYVGGEDGLYAIVGA
jgi:hypothetical protein